MAETAATLRGVSFGYDNTRSILRDLNLDVHRGRLIALLGPNGSGKTTLLKLIAGALRPTTGTIDLSLVVGFVPQLTEIAFAYSVFDMVLMGRARQVGTFAVPSRHDEAVATNALERVGMIDFAARTFDTLSGGERQLVMFARALASEATLLVLDEPTAALDLAHQRLILRAMHKLCRDQGTTIVFSTHQPELAAAAADDIVLMFKGGAIVAGERASVLTAERLSQVFEIDVRRARIDGDVNAREVFVPAWNLASDE
ncbi:MAG TPA: ABC transporter ATP-binding protein [Gemmatimonadaceae bacterium]